MYNCIRNLLLLETDKLTHKFEYVSFLPDHPTTRPRPQPRPLIITSHRRRFRMNIHSAMKISQPSTCMYGTHSVNNTLCINLIVCMCYCKIKFWACCQLRKYFFFTLKFPVLVWCCFYESIFFITWKFSDLRYQYTARILYTLIFHLLTMLNPPSLTPPPSRNTSEGRRLLWTIPCECR